MTIGERMRILRKYHGMSQEELAKKSNVGLEAIKSLENDIYAHACIISEETLESIAKTLRVHPSVFTGPIRSVPKNITRIRKSLHMSYEEFGKDVRCTAQTIKDLEAGVRTATSQTIKAMSNKHGVPLSEFYDDGTTKETLMKMVRLNKKWDEKPMRYRYFTTIRQWVEKTPLGNLGRYEIAYANDTKVKYLIMNRDVPVPSTGITPLYNPDGTLQVYEGKDDVKKEEYGRMDKSMIVPGRKDAIIKALLDEYMTGITQDGLEVLQGIMFKDELEAYGYDLSETE